MHAHWMRYVWALVVLGVLIIITALISMLAPSAAPVSQDPAGFPAYVPPPRAQDAVAAQHGFDALVSFTDNGFEPATIVIKAGETIRFSNNASAPLRLMSTDSNLFAATGSIAPRGYVELTFPQSGQFHYSDARSGTSGTIIVQ